MYKFSQAVDLKEVAQVEEDQSVCVWLVGKSGFVDGVEKLIHQHLMPESKAKQWVVEKLIFEDRVSAVDAYIEVSVSLVSEKFPVDFMIVEEDVMLKPHFDAVVEIVNNSKDKRIKQIFSGHQSF